MGSQEILDIFDDNMELIGKATREETHLKGHWHQTFHCWLISIEEGIPYVLFQRRGPDKKLYPNTLDITAAGHLTSGEKPEDGLRELNEELGISVQYDNLVYLGIRCDVAIIGSVVNREFCHTYLLESNIPLISYKLQAEEVSGLVRMKIDDGLRLFSGEVRSVSVEGYQLDEKGERSEVRIDITKNDIIPRLDNLYMKILIMSERHFNGNHYLAI